MSDATPAIKHCPFCGSPAEFEYTPWDEEDQSGDDGSGKVECIKCGASISGYVDDAIEKWNSRLSEVSIPSDQRCKTCANRDEHGYCRSPKLDERIKVDQNDIEELLHDLSIARAGVDGINAIIGNVVTLKSASDVKMTAARMADDGGVLCVWMHNGVVQSASIPLAALVDWP